MVCSLPWASVIVEEIARFCLYKSFSNKYALVFNYKQSRLSTG